MLKVQIREICLKTPRENRAILNDAFFDLAANNIFTILGKNGSGKSTLIKAITNLLDSKSYSVIGEIYYNNENINLLSAEKLQEIRKNNIKYVFQDAVNSFDPLKKLKYYFDFLAKDSSLIEETLDYFLLPPTRDLFQMHSYEVSGGMAQRISFALAILSKPEIIILDEPTSGIDSAIANLFLLKLKEFSKLNNNSVLLVTQDVTFAEKVSDKIAFLKNGRLSEFYEPQQFISKTDDQLLTEFLSATNKINNNE
ncbi:MAG: ATP-binding cassette domain-containing protein [Ignavibacteriaceae bacterium]